MSLCHDDFDQSDSAYQIEVSSPSDGRIKMAGTKTINLSANEFAMIYRICITTSVESIAETRALNRVLDALESIGDPLPQSDGEAAAGVPQMFGAPDGASITFTDSDADTLKRHLDNGIGRFQYWSIRSLPEVIDRLSSSTKEPIAEA